MLRATTECVLKPSHRMANIYLISGDTVIKINFLKASSYNHWPTKEKKLKHCVSM
jgi:hypothetical protein